MLLNELLGELSRRNIKLWLEEDQLRLAAPKGALTPELRQALGEKKPEILAFLQKSMAGGANYTPITPAAPDQDIPLSYAQERLWVLDQLVPGNTAYNLFLAYHLLGDLSLDALEKSLKEIQQRHEILRTTFVVKGDQTFQVVAEDLTAKLEVQDIRNLAEAKTEAYWEQLATQTVQQPYYLNQLPLWRLKVIRLSDTENILIFTMHHIISDGVSLKVFMEELSELYGAFVNDKPSPLTPLPLQYKDYAVWQRQWLQGKVLESQLDYWEKHFSGDPVALKLPTSSQPPAMQTYRAGYQSLKISQKLTQSLKSVANQEGVSLFVVLFTTFALLLNRYTSQEDLILCSPVLGRNQSELDRVIGYFNNILPLRINVEGNPTLRQLLTRVSKTTLDAYENQDVPFQKLAELPNLAKVNLSKALFTLQNAPSEALNLTGITPRSLKLFKGMADFDVFFFMEEKEEIILGEIVFKADLFANEIIFKLLGNYQNLLEILVSNTELKISSLPQFLEEQSAPVDELQTNEKQQYVAPRNDIEAKLANIWEKLLNTKSIGVKDHFFNTLGGSSLLAFRLFSEIDKTFQKNLPLATLLQSPTIEKLALVLAQDELNPSWTSLVPLKTNGSNPPLFCVHAAGGNVLGYLDLAECLSDNQPVYGLQIKGLDGVIPDSYEVKQMAKEYLLEIRAFQPQGPYYLAGHSGGGIVAFEMAQQLVSVGEKVGILAMFDTYNPSFLRKTREEDQKYFDQQTSLKIIQLKAGKSWYTFKARWLNPIQKHLKLLFTTKPTEIPDYLSKQVNKQLDKFKDKLEALNYKFSQDSEKPLPYFLRQQAITQKFGHAAFVYTPESYPGKIIMFSTEINRHRWSNIIDDDDRGWISIPTEGIEIYKVPGNHIDLLWYPKVFKVAEKLQLLLDREIAANNQAVLTR